MPGNRPSDKAWGGQLPVCQGVDVVNRPVGCMRRAVLA